MAKTEYINQRTWTQDLDDLNNRAKSQRAPYEIIWDEIDRNFFPYQTRRNGNTTALTPSTQRKSAIPEAILNNCVSMAASYIIPSTEAGLRIEFTTPNDNHDDNEAISNASKLVIDKLHQTGDKDNTLYQALYPTTEDNLSYGNGAILIEYRPDSTDPIISSIDIRELYILAEYKTGIIHTVFREAYAENTLESEMIVEVWRDMSYDNKKIPLMINRQETYPINYRKYFKNNGQLLEQRVLPEMPIRYSRMFLKPGQIYGMGLGQRALITAKRYHAICDEANYITGCLASAPVGVIRENFAEPEKISFTPKAINFLAQNIQGGPPVTPLVVVNPAAIQATELALQRCEAELRQALMESSLMIPGETLDKMTATAVTFYADQKNSLIAPALIGMTSSILHGIARIQLYRLIERGIIQFTEKGNIEDLQFSFMSKQDMMRKKVEANIKMQQIQAILGIANSGYPQIMDLVDMDELATDMLENEGMDKKCEVDEATVEDIRKKRQEQQRQAAMAQTALQATQQ